MYLSRLVISNFRSINQLDLAFRKGKNIIIGRNNAGKSNIAKAIDLILGESSPAYEKSDNIDENDFFSGDLTKKIIIYAELTREQDEELNYDELYKCYGFKTYSEITGWERINNKNKPIKKPIRIKAEHEDLKQFIKNLELSFEPNEDDSSEYINPKLRNQQTFENQFSDKYRFAFVFCAEKMEGGKINKSIRFLYRENHSTDWVLAFTAPIRTELLQSAMIPSFRDPQNQLRISNWSWYGKLLKEYVDPENQNLKDAFLQVQEASNDVFANLQNKINNSKVKVAFPSTNISFQFNPDTKQDVHKSALIYVDDGFKSQLQDKGSGIQSAIIIGLFHFYTREIAHSGCSLLMIEEPELYLHPHGRRVISNRLDDFLEEGKNQVIVTTHSPEFMCSSNEELNIIIVKKDITGTSARNVSFAESKEKQILVKSQNSEMFFADYVILVEGGGDKFILEALALEFGNQKGDLDKNWLNDKNISVIAVTGKTEFWKYAQKLSEAGIAYCVIADFDFLLEGLSDYFTKLSLSELKGTHNSINGKIGSSGLKAEKLNDLNVKLQSEVMDFFRQLKDQGIYILNGKLENFYTDKAKEIIEGVSGKEERALHIVMATLDGNNICDYIEYNDFFNIFEILKALDLEFGKSSPNLSIVPDPTHGETTEADILNPSELEVEQINIEDIPF